MSTTFAGLFLHKQKEALLLRQKEAFPLWETIASLGKKALFVTSVPFYWLVFFTKILQWYDANFFIFVVIASMVLSVLGKNWGILHFLVK